MSGGQQVDAGKLSGAGGAYTDKGEDLKTAGGKLETNINTGKVGKAWSNVSTPYVEAIGKYRDAVTKYGEQVAGLGDKMSQAAKAYENNETFTADEISSKGV